MVYREEGYSGEAYIILPGERIGSILQDTIALRMLNELHEIKKINNLFLKKNEQYPSVKDYCVKREIELGVVSDNSELIEEITRFYGKDFKRFTYVTHSEDDDSLEDCIKELADFGFYTEIRMPNP